jgi:phage-related protein
MSGYNQMLIGSTDASTYGLYLTNVPPVTKPQRRVRRIVIPGRSGNLTEWSGDYESYIKEPEFYYSGSALETALNALRDAELVTFGNESTYAYEVRADEQIEVRMDRAGGYEIKVAYITQPLKRLATEPVHDEETTYSITNLGNEPAYPKLVVTGAGSKTVTVGTQTITLAFSAGGETLTVDSLNGMVYDGSGNNAWDKLTGDLPYIPVSSSAITVSTTGSALTVYPNWRWS